MNLGVYCETLEPDALQDPEVKDLLAAYKVTLGHALRYPEEGGGFDPDLLSSRLDLACRLRESECGYALWPLLPKSMGYWVNERNLDATDRMADAIIEGCRRFGAKPDLLIMDVETSWQQTEAVLFPGPPAWRKAFSVLHMLFANRDPARFARSVSRLSSIVDRLRREVAPVAATAFPLLVADLAVQGNAMQDYLEMPVFPVKFDAWNAMFYNSYMPAAMPWLVPHEGAARMLYEYASILSGRFGQGAWITLGSTWEGVLPGNEGRTYPRAEMLAPDVASAKAAGVATLWLYCLEGVLYQDQKLTKRRPRDEAERFFAVMSETPAAEPAMNPKWSRGRRILERIAKDRRKAAYGWDKI